MQRLKVATAQSPLGPFEYKATLSKSFCIDADVMIHADKPWSIFYATNDFRGNDPRYPGTCIVEDKLVTPFKLAGVPREAAIPTNQGELFCKNRFGDGRDWFTIEAPCPYEDQNRQFLLYSGNAYTSENYFVSDIGFDCVLYIASMINNQDGNTFISQTNTAGQTASSLFSFD